MSETAQKRAGGAPKSNKNALVHGFYSRQRQLKRRGSHAIDRRTVEGKFLATWREAYEQDLGGPENISTARGTLLDLAEGDFLQVIEADAYIETAGSINKRRRSFHPIVGQRNAAAERLSRRLVQIGLDRVEAKPPSLAEFLAQREAQGEQVPESKAEPAASAQAQPDGQEPLSERPRDVVNGRFVGAEAEQVDVGATETA